jgi:hypothetical protein
VIRSIVTTEVTITACMNDNYRRTQQRPVALTRGGFHGFLTGADE